MSKIIKVLPDNFIEIREYKSPNICFYTNEYDDFEKMCTLREVINPFDMYYENKQLKEVIEEAKDMLDLIIPELWNVNNAMTYKVKAVRRVLDKVKGE